MTRNEYRRAFIMLRAVMPGYGGHVRLERRTLTGSMYFIITAPQGVGELAAALVGRQDGKYFAAPIGPLSRDRRGQLALAWQFDPRSIAGRPLEAYAWVTVVATGGPCALALTGNVEGSRPVDARALGEAACALFAPTREAPAADLPVAESGEGPAGGGLTWMESGGDLSGSEGAGAPAGGDGARSGAVAAPSDGGQGVSEAATGTSRGDEATSGASGADRAASGAGAVPSAGGQAVSGAGTVPIGSNPAGPEAADAGETCGDVRVYTMTRARLRHAAASRPAGQDKAGSPARPAAEPSQPANEPAQGGAGGDPVPTVPEPTAPEGPATGPAPVTAAKQLGLDITEPWPGDAEALRRLFATQVQAADAPDDGFTYVAFPMPEGSGYGESLVGLKAEGGRITAIRHALPAMRAPESPAGMEAATWLPGDGGKGFWVTEGEF